MKIAKCLYNLLQVSNIFPNFAINRYNKGETTTIIN